MKPASVIITRFPFTSQLGGEEIHTFAVANHLREVGHSVEFLTSCPVLRKFAHRNGFSTRKVWLFKPPVTLGTYFVFNLLSPFLFLWSLLIVLKIRLSRRNPKIYALSFTEKILFAPWCWVFKIKMIWVEHARIGNWFTKNLWKPWYKLWAMGSSVELVTVSKVMKKDLGIADVVVIPNAIDAKKFSKQYDAEILPDELKKYLREKKFNIGYVGRLSKDKGMEVLIEAAEVLDKVGIITVGSGPYKKLLEENDIRNVPFLTVEQVACFMQNIDLLVLPATETDPFGLVVLEGIAAGCPVMISDKVGIKDYLVVNKEVILENVESFSKKLEKIVLDPSQLKQIQNIQEKVLDRFKYKDMLDSYAKLFE